MKVRVVVDGKEIPLNAFASKVVGSTTMSLVSSLKYVERPRKVIVELEMDETSSAT